MGTDTGPAQYLKPGPVAERGKVVASKATSEGFVIPLGWRNRTDLVPVPGLPAGMPGGVLSSALP